MNFEEYLIEVHKFGNSIDWNFHIHINPTTLDRVLTTTNVNNLNPVIKTFKHEYVIRNLDWTSELKLLKTKILGDVIA